MLPPSTQTLHRTYVAAALIVAALCVMVLLAGCASKPVQTREGSEAENSIADAHERLHVRADESAPKYDDLVALLESIKTQIGRLKLK